jgi:hypothetical protein
MREVNRSIIWLEHHPMPKFFSRVDFIYITPAILCCLAIFCGLIPPLFCLTSSIFMYISIGVFVVSILIHIVILCLWKRYSNVAPFAYAIVQPCLHLILLTFALFVGSTNLCAVNSVKILRNSDLKEFDLEYKGKMDDKSGSVINPAALYVELITNAGCVSCGFSRVT